MCRLVVNADEYESRTDPSGNPVLPACDDCDSDDCDEGRWWDWDDIWLPCCPRKLMGDPHVQAVVAVHNAAAANPLSDWPQGYAAWVPQGWVALKAMIEERRENEKEARRA